MPIPKPDTGEKQDDFISRCISNDTMNEDYPDEKQRAAVCYSSWRKEHGDSEPQERAWFKINLQAGETPEVYIYDEIGRGFFGGGVSADRFVAEVKALKLKPRDELLVRINSPGGDVFDGIAIYNYLRGTKHRVRVRVDGVAASAASVIAMAGDSVEMPANAYLMIHNPWMMAVGDAGTLRKAASDLERIGEAVVATYQRRAGDRIQRAELSALLDAETWLSAEDAVQLGLADQIYEPVRAAALARFPWARMPYRVPEVVAKAGKFTVDVAAERAKLRRLGMGAREREVG